MEVNIEEYNKTEINNLTESKDDNLFITTGEDSTIIDLKTERHYNILANTSLKLNNKFN